MKVIPFKSETTPWRVSLPPSWFPDHKVKVRYFRTKDLGEKFLRRCKDEGRHALNEIHDGEAPIIGKRAKDRLTIIVEDVLEKLGNDAGALYAAIEHYQKTLQKIKVVNVREFVELYHVYRKEVCIPSGEIGVRTEKEDHHRLRRFVTEYEQVPVTDITLANLREFFAKQSVGSARSIYKNMRSLFVWGHNYGYLGENPMAKIEAKTVGEFGVNKGIYLAEEGKRMFRIAAGLEPIIEGGEITYKYLDLLPWLVFSGFGALRSCEIVRDNEADDVVRWTDVDGCLERGFFKVRVPKGGTDPRNPKLIHAIEAIKAWVGYIKRRNEFVCPLINAQFQELRQKFFKEIGIKFQKNGLRNSASTYLWNCNNGLDDVAQFMGNSPGTAKEHYVEDLEPGLGEQWFSIRPFEAVETELRTA